MIRVLLFSWIHCFFFSVLFSQNQHIYPQQKRMWDSDSLGSQRAVIKILKPLKNICINIEWRNRNVTSKQKVYVVDSASNTFVKDVVQLSMSAEQGTISFNPLGKVGIFYIYYLPYQLLPPIHYPNALYKNKNEEDDSTVIKLSNSDDVVFLRFESVDAFNSNYPMEIIATQQEESQLRKKYILKEYVIIPEHREFPIKMNKNLTQRWVNYGIAEYFQDNVRKGENFTFQLGLWALKTDLKDIEIEASPLQSYNGVILANKITCFNTEGVDYKGVPFIQNITIRKDIIQPLWFGIRIPKNAPPNKYKGSIMITANKVRTTIPIELNVANEIVDSLLDEPWKQTRLHWINSSLAQENRVIKPYIPLRLNKNSIDLLGRRLTVGKNGLPVQVSSFFTEEMTSISTKKNDVLVAPFILKLIGVNKEELTLRNISPLAFTQKEEGLISWKSKNATDKVEVNISGALEFDGFADFQIQVIAKDTIALKDIVLSVKMQEQMAQYILGLNLKGQQTPKQINWTWDVANKHQDGMWLGGVNGGLQFSFRDQHYRRPLNTNFYLQGPLLLPKSWGNENKGGIDIKRGKDVVTMDIYSGNRIMRKGDTLFYNFTLLITPFHPIQTDAQWSNRYYHAAKPIDSAIKNGCNIVNLHHANAYNPYINYPFIATKEMKSYIDDAHRKGVRVKIYNTVREVSNRLYELYPMLSFNHEIFSHGEGKGYSWLKEHLWGGYIGAWYTPQFQDAAIVNSGMSRWHNYYVEGMNWLVQNINIDGIYLDDVAFDRVTMKRIKRVLTQNHHPGIIDLHSANQYNKRDGFNNSALLYMEHFPYLDRLWFGEYFDYEKADPDFFLTEVSGIPYGLMGEMLQDGGNAWKGMLYGMTNRKYGQGYKSPEYIWNVWDDFGMQKSKMIGYWVSKSPIKTNNKAVLSTIYKNNKKVLIAVANFSDSDTTFQLNINWRELGLNPKRIVFSVPAIKNFQDEATFSVGDIIPIKKQQGWIFILQERQ